MAERATARTDFVPHLPDLIVSMAACWRAIRDAQTEVDPFGPNFGALEDTGAAIEILADRLTGQSGFLALGEAMTPRGGRTATALAPDGDPF